MPNYWLNLTVSGHPTLTPARNIIWIDTWGRANIKAVYRVQPDIISGRMTVPEGETRGSITTSNN